MNLHTPYLNCCVKLHQFWMNNFKFVGNKNESLLINRFISNLQSPFALRNGSAIIKCH